MLIRFPFSLEALAWWHENSCSDGITGLAWRPSGTARCVRREVLRLPSPVLVSLWHTMAELCADYHWWYWWSYDKSWISHWHLRLLAAWACFWSRKPSSVPWSTFTAVSLTPWSEVGLMGDSVGPRQPYVEDCVRSFLFLCRVSSVPVMTPQLNTAWWNVYAENPQVFEEILMNPYRIIYWLVVWNMNFIFPYIGNVSIPTDIHIIYI